MNRAFSPASIAPPFSNYAHGVEVPPGARLLHVSGQIGITPSGKVPGDFAGQCEQSFRNILAVLAEAGMGPADLVKVNAYLTRLEDRQAYRDIRDRMLGGHRCASTLLVVAALASPDWLVEIEAVAAKA